jgi:ATP-dependent Clp protease ATP-binding subunit ClpC
MQNKYIVVLACHYLPLKRAIQSVVEDALAEEILLKKVVPGDKVSAGFKNGKVVFTVKN